MNLPKTSVELVSLTLDASGYRTAEQLLVHIARVSNPSNQDNDATAPKLIRYLLDHGHFSPFEQVDMGVKVVTSRAISRQILRHWSFHVQEFSQRYAKVEDGVILASALGQHPTNRQMAVDNLSDVDRKWFERAQLVNWEAAYQLYGDALKRGIAKECARFLLPEGGVSTIYLKATVRDWIFYLRARLAVETQQAHREVAALIQKHFVAQFPHTAEALGWSACADGEITINERSPRL